MKPTPFNFPIFIILLGIGLGIIFQDLWHIISLFQSIYLVIIAIGVLFFCFYTLKKFQKEGIFVASLCIGILSYNIHYEPYQKLHYLQKLSTEKEYLLFGTIEKVKGKRAIIALEEVDKIKITGQISLQLNDTLPSNSVGKFILFSTKLSPITAPKNPLQFDYKRYMQQQGVYWQGFAPSYLIRENTSFSLVHWAKKWQMSLASSLDSYPFSQENKSVLKALVLGVRSDIDADTYQHYIDAGAVHILAISGLHIGIITLLLTQIVNILLPLRDKRIKMGIIFGFLLFYSLITGLSASVLRSVLMFGSYSVASFSNQKKARFDSLMLSAFFLLLCRPTFLFEVGFQLSFIAVLSIEVFLPLFNKYWFYENKYLNLFPNIIKVSIATQIGIIPISLYYFHQFAGLFLFTNMLILPFMGILLGLGLLAVFLANIHLLPFWLVQSYDFLLSLMNGSIDKISSYRSTVISGIYFDQAMLFISYVSLIFITLFFYLKRVRFLSYFLICVLCFQTYLFYKKYEKEKIQQLIVYQQYKNTLISLQQGGSISFYISDSSAIPKVYIKNLSTQKQLNQIDYKPIKNVFHLKEDYLLIIDDKFYLDSSYPSAYLLLRNNPKIHLEKFLQEFSPKAIIADGSNYPFMVEKWKETCEKYQIHFHYTQKNGAFTID